MSNILHYIANPDKNDPEAKLIALEEWSENIAKKLANEESLELNNEHVQLSIKLRDHYIEEQSWNKPRAILKFLESEIVKIDPNSKLNPRKKLYSLFPNGPVRQCCKIAGLPIPANSSDPSFGSVH